MFTSGKIVPGVVEGIVLLLILWSSPTLAVGYCTLKAAKLLRTFGISVMLWLRENRRWGSKFHPSHRFYLLLVRAIMFLLGNLSPEPTVVDGTC